jgi:heptaprenyl diphosphate synthase
VGFVSDSTTIASLGGFEFTDPDLMHTVKRGLDRVDELMHRELRSDLALTTEIALHLINAGGKRFRPLFTLLAAQFGHGESDDVVRAAAAVELIHLATLYHDDVMDEAPMRRGAASANTRWHNSVAILAGDYLFAHASRLVAGLGPDAVRITAETFAELVTGQMRETVGPTSADEPIDHYLRVVGEKTGSLIATAGRFGAMFADAPPEHVEALSRYGKHIGVAFQISDDVIDIASPADESGKTPGTDLREGVRTLPMLYALADNPEPRLVSLLAGPITDDALLSEALELLRASTGLDRTRDKLADVAAAARAELAALPRTAATHALESLTHYVVERSG